MSVSLWNSRLVSESSERLNWSSQPGDGREPGARSGVRGETLRADLREPAAIEALVAGAEKPFLELEPADWGEVLAVDLRVPALCARAAARAMVARRRARIINIASISATEPAARLAPYCASKAGLVRLTRVMALEPARHNVQVNCVCPGDFATPMNAAFFATAAGQAAIARAIPMRRLGAPAELGPVIVFLASEASSFMTGSVITVDGGQSLT